MTATAASFTATSPVATAPPATAPPATAPAAPAPAASAAIAFDVEVKVVRRLSPTYVRITFGGQSLAGFNTGGALGPRDLRVKLMIPSPGYPLPDFSDMTDGWYRRWLARDVEVRGAMRTYTVCAIRPAGMQTEVDVDFVHHVGAAGPACAWASAAQPGDRITIIGPNGACDGYGGVEWRPPVVACGRRVRVLLAGDETAVPAISSVLATLPTGYVGHAVLEVPEPEDFREMPTAADIEMLWLARGARPHGTALDTAVREVMVNGAPGPRSAGAALLPEVDIDHEVLWETCDSAPEESAGFYAWVAGEAAMVRDLRRFLVREVRVDRSAVAFMGYWRHGRAEG